MHLQSKLISILIGFISIGTALFIQKIMESTPENLIVEILVPNDGQIWIIPINGKTILEDKISSHESYYHIFEDSVPKKFIVKYTSVSGYMSEKEFVSSRFATGNVVQANFRFNNKEPYSTGELLEIKAGDLVFEFSYIPNGSYAKRDLDLVVEIDKPFLMLRREVSRNEWHGVLKDKGLPKYPANHPITGIVYQDILRFLSTFEELTGLKAELPNESAWEYASLDLSNSTFFTGNRLLTEYANFKHGPSKVPEMLAVGQREPSINFKLYDMHGNASEYVFSLDGKDVLRKGGAFNDVMHSCKPFKSKKLRKNLPYRYTGFRFIIFK